MALAAYNKRKELIKIFEEEDGEIIYHNNWQQMLGRVKLEVRHKPPN